MHLTDKVEFTVQIHGALATIKILIMKSFISWKIPIGTSMYKIQRMPFMVAGPHWYSNILLEGEDSAWYIFPSIFNRNHCIIAWLLDMQFCSYCVYSSSWLVMLQQSDNSTSILPEKSSEPCALLINCLAKVLWTGQTKNCLLSVPEMSDISH